MKHALTFSLVRLLSSSVQPEAAELEIKNFGPSPSGLTMHLYVPEDTPRRLPYSWQFTTAPAPDPNSIMAVVYPNWRTGTAF